MQNFDASTFLALPAAKAKAAALSLFDSAMVEPFADWRGVAFALHAVVNRKRGKVEPVAIADQDAADACELIAWADYQPSGKGTAIARGRVTVTFADGWTRTVGMLAGRTAKGRKPWSIAHAVRFAVICYKLAAARRATGSDDAMYFDKGGNQSGETVTLDALIEAPEIVSVVSADSSETVEGDLIWNPCEANAFTRDLRAGAVAVPLALAPMPQGIADALRDARRDLIGRMGLERNPLYALAKEAAARVEALLFPADVLSPRRSAAREALFPLVWGEDRDAYPMDEAESEARAERIAAADAVEFPTDAPADDEIAAECLEPAALVEAACEAVEMDDDSANATADDGSAYLVAMEIVGAFDDDACGRWLAPSTWSDRRIAIEDALIAWPALVDAETGIPASEQEPQASPLDPVAEIAAPMVAEIPVTPVAKPRYRYSPVSQTWELVEPDGEPMRLAA